MLRTAFVLALFAVGVFFAMQGAFYALLLYFWIAYFRPQEWVWTDFIQSLNLSLLTGMYLVAITMASGVRHRFNGRVALMVLFLLQTFISLFATFHTDDLWTRWQDFLKSTIISYCIVVLVTDRRRLRLAVMVIAVSLAFEPAKQAWAQLILAPGTQNFNSIGFLGDNNGVGVGMLMLVPLLAVLARTSSGAAQKWGLRFLAVGVLYRAVSTYSRGAFLGSIAIGVAFFLRSKHKSRALIAAAICATLIFSVLPEGYWQRMGTIQTSEDDMDTSSRGRVHFWRVAVEMANKNPLFGVGPNAYNTVYDRYDFSGGEYGANRSVHSTWFGVLAETGYLGLLLFVMNIAGVFVGCRRVRVMARRSPELQELREYTFALETSFVGFIVASSFVIFQYVEMVWHLVGLSIALVAIAEAEGEALQPAEAIVPQAPQREHRHGSPLPNPISFAPPR